MPTSVMVQHRSRSLLEVLAGSIATEPGLRLVGVAHDGAEALRLCQRERPDVALIESDPSGWDAAALAAELRSSRAAQRVVGLCAPDCPCQRVSARWLGRGTLVPAAGGVDAVLEAIRLAMRQRTVLTDRELEVLRLLGAGHTGGEISRLLGISQRTVDNYKGRLFQKLGVQSKAHAVASAARLGLLPPCLARSGAVADQVHRPSTARVVLGPPGPLRDRLAALLTRQQRPGGAGEGTDTAVAVLVDPSDEDWEAARELGARIVLVVPVAVDQALALQSVLRGADALLTAEQAPARLLETVELVAEGHALVGPALIRTLLDAMRLRLADQGTPPQLTVRERQILASIDRGESVKQTARALGISAKTVENLQHRLFRKLGVRNRAEAVAAAHSRRLLAPPDSSGDR
jgi:DNA-binding NarL/FixJ family response regulator